MGICFGNATFSLRLGAVCVAVPKRRESNSEAEQMNKDAFEQQCSVYIKQM